MKKIILILIIFPVYLLSQIKIALLDNSSVNQIEFSAAYSFFKNQSNIHIEKISFDDAKEINVLKNFPLVWIHRVDSTKLHKYEYDESFISSLKKYLSDGGKLFLSIDALKYLNVLEVESEEPISKYVYAIDEGYGRKFGLHSFINHPVFNGLYGGAYIFNPIEDIKIRQVGFFENQKKLKGKIIAVDWSYITLKENSKLLLEYDFGKGKILACGAYLYFDMINQNKNHFEKFLTNCFEYLTQNKVDTQKYFWNDFSSAELIQRNFEKVKFNNSKKWKTDGEIKLTRVSATDNYWNVAGEKILVMGKEKNGIDEIWSHPFMALKNYEIGFKENDTINWFKNLISKIEVYPNSVVRIYKANEIELKEVITTSVDKPVAIIHYEIINNKNKKLFIKFQSNMRLMWPYSENVLGNINFDWNKNLNAFIIQDERKIYSTLIGFNTQIKNYTIDNVDNLTKQALVELNASQTKYFDVVISSSNENINKLISYYKSSLINTYQTYYSSKKHYENQLKKLISIKSPDKDFNEGYNWALIGTKKFIVNTPQIGKSIVAGYSTTARGWNGGHKINGRPGYAWYFGRDGVWSGFALLDLGDYETVKSIIKMFNKYQDINGKIFHELTTSGVVHYDASDSTPLYLILCGRYLKESGDINFIKQNIDHIKKAIQFCYSTDTDKDNLIENTNVGHGWVEGGGLYTAHTEVYLAACWAEALKWSGYIFDKLKLFNEAKKYFEDYETVKKIINTKFWDEEKQTLSFSKLKDGSYNNEKTVLSAVPIYFDMIDSLKAKTVLKDYSENYFSSDWGVRILRNDSKIYNPGGYHTGSVWPLFTGWTALAEYKYQNDVQAFTHLMNNLLIYKNWQLGAIEEVLNGNEYKPSGVCPQQCWSQTMVIQPTIEGLLGLEIDAINKSIKIEPKLPADWNYLKVNNIKVGDKVIHFSFEKVNGKTRFNFISNDNKKIKFYVKYENQLDSFYLKKNYSVTFNNKNNPKVLPHYVLPKPNDISKGFRIVSEKYSNNNYEIEVQGLKNNIDTLKIFSPQKKIEKIENGEMIKYENHIYNVKVNFDEGNEKYINKTLKINFRE